MTMSREPAIHIRPVRTLDEYRACITLQEATWGEGFNELVPLSILKVGQRIGGVTAGAFDASGELVGFVFGLTGVEPGGRLVHWSDMLAVRSDHRNRGIGQRLKAFQRDSLRALGVELMYWTFDPLVARNAHLNLNRLGARVTEYVPDMYGASDSPLHRGLGTDRFVVAWPLVEGPRPATSPSDGPHDAPVVNPGSRGEATALDRARAGARRVRIRIPSDIHAVQKVSMDDAVAWRQGTRQAFMEVTALGYGVTGFQRDADASSGAYVLERTADQGGTR